MNFFVRFILYDCSCVFKPDTNSGAGGNLYIQTARRLQNHINGLLRGKGEANASDLHRIAHKVALTWYYYFSQLLQGELQIQRGRKKNQKGTSMRILNFLLLLLSSSFLPFHLKCVCFVILLFFILFIFHFHCESEKGRCADEKKEQKEWSPKVPIRRQWNTQKKIIMKWTNKWKNVQGRKKGLKPYTGQAVDRWPN